MTNEEARFILRAYRPSGQDAADPQFAEALEQVRRDPELARWFEAERAFDADVARALRSVPVPANLEANLLAGRRVIAAAPVWKRRSILAIAAGIAFLLTVGVSVWSPWGGSSFRKFSTAMVRVITEGEFALTLRSADVQEVRQWLAGNAGHEDFAVPAPMQPLPTFGCQVLQWRGRPVSLICFQHERAVLHLFVIDRAQFSDPPPEGNPRIAQVNDELIAMWTRGKHAYLLTGLNDTAVLKKLL